MNTDQRLRWGYGRGLTSCTLATAIAGLVAGLATTATAQVVTDGSVGARQTLNGETMQIPNGLGRQSGGNLLHSFDSFNLNNQQTATFGVPNGVDRVISRVTGSGASSIDGIVSFADANFAAPAAADFFFFNPNGVLIGPNAQFRTSGALYFSGGDGLRFSDGSTIFTDPAAGLTLTSAAPEAFGFFNQAPGPVTITGNPLPLQGDGVALSGGTITIDNGSLNAENRENIVLITGGQGDLAPISAADAGGPATGGTIRVLGTGDGQENLFTNGSGDIVIRGGTVSIEGGTILARPLTGDGGSIRIDADVLSLTDRGTISTIAEREFDASSVTVTARDISILGGSAIRSQATGDGAAGTIDVTGFDRMLISRDGTLGETVIESEVAGGASGNGGNVRVIGGDLVLADGGRIFSSTFGAGDAGSVVVRLRSLDATGGAQIGTGALDTPGQPGIATGAGGDLRLIASQEIRFSGLLPESLDDVEPEPSGLFSGSEGTASGNGGDVFVRAPRIILTNEAEIGAETFGAADAGTVTLTGGDLIASGGAEITTTSRTSGVAGEVRIELTGDLTVDTGSEIASRAGGADGVAGQVFATARNLTIADGAEVTTASTSSDGGAITLIGTGRTIIDAANVNTSVGSSDGNGGAILVDGRSLFLLNDSTIASTAQLGAGGEVVVGSGFAFIEPTSAIDVSSAFGTDGVVSILGVIGDQSTETETPPAAFFNRFALIDDFCVAAVTGGSALRLVAPTGRPFDAATTPALFGNAIPYPGTGDALTSAAPPLVLAASADIPCNDRS